MNTFQQSTLALKKVLKSKKIGYLEIANYLHTSESTIKRFLNSDDGSMNKIAKICELCEMTLPDLLEIAIKKETERFYLPEDVDEFFANYYHYFSFFMLLYKHKWNVEEIQSSFNLTDKCVFKYLKKLDELKLLELNKENQFKFLVQGDLHTTPQNGPLFHVWWNHTTRPFVTKVIEESADRSRYCLKSYKTALTEKNYLDFNQRLTNLSLEFINRSKRDQQQNSKQDLIETSLLIAYGSYDEDLKVLYPVKKDP